MTEPQRKIWRVNRSPRFTVLEMGEYMVLDDGPRETMRRDMKYERITPTTIYSKVHRAVARFLASPTRDRKILADCRRLLETEIVNARTPRGRENVVYALRALDTFENSLNALPISGINLEHSPIFPVRLFGGVKLSVQPTVLVRVARPRGKDLRGAIIIDLAKGTEPKSDEGKTRASGAMTHSSYLLHEHIASVVASEDERPSPEHCMVFHTHRQELVSSPPNYRRMLGNAEAACRGIAGAWRLIKPPPTFDPALATYRD